VPGTARGKISLTAKDIGATGTETKFHPVDILEAKDRGPGGGGVGLIIMMLNEVPVPAGIVIDEFTIISVTGNAVPTSGFNVHELSYMPRFDDQLITTGLEITKSPEIMILNESTCVGGIKSNLVEILLARDFKIVMQLFVV
jgi:hypothetical protein